MKRIGNVESNKTYNPRNVKPQIPIDIDEVDSAMERYIRQKYEQRVYMNSVRLAGQQNTGSTSSDDRPPPLPPKPTGRFGFGLRKAATAPRDLTPPLSPGIGAFEHELSPPRVNKPSRIFGSNVHTSGDGLDSKLATLRDMGFPDEKRNCTVLKGLNGNLDRTVETLIRLGEQNVGASRGSTPTPPTRSASTGLTFERTNSVPAATSTNPFDALDTQPRPQVTLPVQPATYGDSSMQPVSPSPSYNPFLQPATQASTQQQYYSQQPQQPQPEQNATYQQNPWGQQSQNFGQSSQGMQLQHLQPQQPLFPNRTGGYGPAPPSHAQTNPFQQSFTPPPMPQISEQYSSFPTQPHYQSMSSPSSPGNPFLKSSRSQAFTPIPTPHGQFSFQQRPQDTQQPHLQQPQLYAMQQQEPNQQETFRQQPQPQQPQPQQPQPQQPQQHQQPNPWATQSHGQVSTAPASNPWQSQHQSIPSQPTGHPIQPPTQSFQDQQQSFQSQKQAYQQQSSNPFDKKAILSLYNQAQPVQQPAQAPQASLSPAPTTNMLSGYMSPFGPQPGVQPFSAAQTAGVRHVSHESVDFSGLLGGRHSPDAFSGLSSSFRR